MDLGACSCPSVVLKGVGDLGLCHWFSEVIDAVGSNKGSVILYHFYT